MKLDDLRSRLRSLTSLFSVAVASTATMPGVLCADDATDSNGSVSIRLLLEPSSPEGEPLAPVAEVQAVEDAVALPPLGAPTLVAQAAERSRELTVRRPVEAQAPEPPALVLDLDADADNLEAKVASEQRSDVTGKVEALPIAAPARRFIGRRYEAAAKKQPEQRTASRTQHPTAEPAPLPPGHDLLSLESSRTSIEQSTQSTTEANTLSLQEPNSLQEPKRLGQPLAAQVIDLDALDELQTSKSKATPKPSDEINAEAGADAECPGSPDGIVLHLDSREEDIPLEQSDHPYDAPKAKSTDEPLKLKALVDSDSGFTEREKAIHRGINDCLHYFIANPENVARRGPWALMHATLPFGVEAEIIAGNRKVNAIGWMCYNGVCAKQRMFQPTRTGFRTNLGPGVQGHEGQFLAILAQSQVSASYPLQIGKNRYTVQDLVRYEMATCREKSELTFKLIGLSHYLPADATWRDSRRHGWNLEKMVAEELAQPVIGAACGGTHRLMGLTYAVMQRQRDGLPMTGHWARAEKFLQDYISYALTLQNPDGSFSTDWFEGRGYDRDVERGVQTTGHILEWLIYSLPEEHLRSPKIQASVEYLIQSVGRNPAHDWPIGPRGHALRALTLYNQRVFGAEAGKMTEHVARNRTPSNLR